MAFKRKKGGWSAEPQPLGPVVIDKHRPMIPIEVIPDPRWPKLDPEDSPYLRGHVWDVGEVVSPASPAMMQKRCPNCYGPLAYLQRMPTDDPKTSVVGFEECVDCSHVWSKQTSVVIFMYQSERFDPVRVAFRVGLRRAEALR